MSTELTSQSPRVARETRAPARKPAFDVSVKDDAYTTRVFLPGIRKNDVTLKLEEDKLTIEANRPSPWPDNVRVLRRELPRGDYRLVLTLGREVDREKIRAEVRDGVLYLTLPKAEASKPRTIEIS